MRPGRLLALAGVVLALLLASPLVQGGPKNDATQGNDSRGLTGGLSDCYAHHRPGIWAPPMEDSHILLPAVPPMIDVGTPRAIELSVYNPWKSEISEVKVYAQVVGNDSVVSLVGGRSVQGPTDVDNATSGRVDSPPATPGVPPRPGAVSQVILPFEVGANALSIDAIVNFTVPDTPDPQAAPQFEVRMFGPPLSRNGAEFLPKNNAAETRTWQARQDQPDNFTFPSPGAWQARITYTRGVIPEIEYEFQLKIRYQSASGQLYTISEQLREPEDITVKPKVLIGTYQTLPVAPVMVQGLKPGTQQVQILVAARLWYKHDAAGGGIYDDEVYNRWATVNVTVTPNTYQPPVAQAITTGGAGGSILVVVGEATGFAAAILLPPSLIFGGTYGRGSRRFVNDMLGGAKRRVMFHNLISLGLTFTALVHVVFFLLETNYTVLMGVLWGGLGALGLLVLGLTGYYQVPLIQRFGFNWWRVVHLATGLLVVVFVAYHALADGDDFIPLREWFPDFLERLNLSNK